VAIGVVSLRISRIWRYEGLLCWSESGHLGRVVGWYIVGEEWVSRSARESKSQGLSMSSTYSRTELKSVLIEFVGDEG